MDLEVSVSIIPFLLLGQGHTGLNIGAAGTASTVTGGNAINTFLWNRRNWDSSANISSVT
jgi:hypothetical protein